MKGDMVMTDKKKLICIVIWLIILLLMSVAQLFIEVGFSLMWKIYAVWFAIGFIMSGIVFDNNEKGNE